jgi:broad-specificity NMP kinase
MINICDNCGKYRADKITNIRENTAICPECNFSMHFLYLPLFIVTGASGTGKSTVCNNLAGNTKNAVVLDSDILLTKEFNTPENNYKNFFEIWLRMAKNISQSGRPVVLFGAGIGVPENIESCIESRYFQDIFYLALHCSDDILEKRLKNRPEWRMSGKKEFIESQINFNNWFNTYHAENPQKMDLLDTSNILIEETTNEIKTWINEKI